jgi:hypothetical protein
MGSKHKASSDDSGRPPQSTARVAAPSDRPSDQAREVAHSPVVRVLLWFVLGLLLLLGVALGYREIASPDLGFHLSTARWIIENGTFPRTDPFTYTVPDRSYVDLQWLFQLLMYGLNHVGGPILIIGATTALTLGCGALLLFRAARRDQRLPLASVALMMLFFLGTHWEPRPHLLSWLFGSLILLVLEEYTRGNRRWLPMLPAIMLLWVNSHSLFVLGLVIMGAYGVRWLMQRPLDRRFIIWTSAAVFACLVNPYHINGLLFPLVQFRDISGASPFKSVLTGIAEFTTPFGFGAYEVDGRLVLFQPRLAWQLFAALAVLGFAGGWRRLRLPEILLFAAFLYVFAKANKNFGYFVMVAFPLAASGLDMLGRSLCSRLPRERREAATTRHMPAPAPAVATVWLLACGALAIVLIAATWSGRLYDLAWMPQRRGSDFNSSILPVEACRFINEHDIEGRVLNSWNDGGYIVWATKLPVFVYSHGEVMGAEFYDRYVHAKQPEGFPGVLDRRQPTVAVVSFEVAPYWLYYLDQSRDWRMVHATEHTATFLHESIAPHVSALPEPGAGDEYPLYDGETARDIILAAAEARGPNLREWLKGSAAYPLREMNRSAFYLLTGELDACIGTALQGIERTPFLVPELMLNLGHAFNARGNYVPADVCFDAFLRADDDPVLAREIERVRAARP